MEALLIGWLKEYGYIILFIWSILEGEMGLIMGGIMCHTGDMWLPLAIFVAGIGGFVGDQVYFYIGRYNKNYIHNKLRSQRRKFAISHLLLKKYGWPIIFVQRYMYGLRTVIPMAIGLTKYSSRKFAFINLISAWMWAALTIIPAYYYGEHLLNFLHWTKQHWYFALPMLGTIAFSILFYLNRLEKNLLEKRRERRPL
ncbi:DedA family protein [Sulfuricurvum sp.]|uniref:DedA family protein n=1 Tax=Sulfuricurvum sp. TaxID=2025608 RepID=UPI00261C1D19|nr:DedA family protein [Sulfuricurvum sp.]MDD2780659.1 DedA family protein [Sulfuricurvum sp.]